MILFIIYLNTFLKLSEILDDSDDLSLITLDVEVSGNRVEITLADELEVPEHSTSCVGHLVEEEDKLSDGEVTYNSHGTVSKVGMSNEIKKKWREM